MKTNAIIFIFTSVIYNLIDLVNDNYNFIDNKFLDDIWYSLMYAHLVFFFYKYKKHNAYINLAFLSSVARLIYNFGIMVNLITYTQYQSTFFVPSFIVLLLILEKVKWLLYPLKR